MLSVVAAKILFLALLFVHELALAQATDTATETRVCGEVYLVSAESIAFTPEEKQLLCGNDDIEAWRNIPANEAGFFARSFLQTRGYYQVETRFDGKKLQIVANDQTIVRSVQLRGNPVAIDVSRYWSIYGRPLTPRSLDDLNKWLRMELGREGIACPEIQIQADPLTGIITVDVKNIGVNYFPQISSENIRGVVGDVERRYDAFSVGERYDSLLLDLTAKRLISDGIVLNAYFLTECKTATADIAITQKINSGQARLISFGFGIDTEEFLIARAQWKNSRFGQMGSNIEAATTASFRVQDARATFNWYYAPVVTRHYLRNLFGFRRENERRYDTRTLSVTSGPAWDLDLGNVAATVWPHVSYEHVETIRGVGDPTSDFVWGNVYLTGQSHEYEYYRNEPREGYEYTFSAGFSRRGAGSDISANRYRFNATRLWNLFGYSPPIWIVGVRGMAATIVADAENTVLLPPNYRYSLGGSTTLRGFGRNALPARDAGAMTVGYAGLELRVANIIPYGLQPIVFGDFGRLGDRALTFDPTLYWSPGTGMHWASPIGVFRATIARGRIEGERASELAHLAQWMFYFSYGEQF